MLEKEFSVALEDLTRVEIECRCGASITLDLENCKESPTRHPEAGAAGKSELRCLQCFEPLVLGLGDIAAAWRKFQRDVAQGGAKLRFRVKSGEVQSEARAQTHELIARKI
jgi:hypothetical protein